jgi:RND family efflux transporter MFP subunit
VLVRFDIPSLNADVLSKTAEVTAAQARVRTTTDNVARLRGLFDRGVAARKEVDDAEKDLADAHAMLAQAEAGHGAAQTLASRSTVTATFDGIIAKRSHNPGDIVDASASDVILRVIDPARLQVDASVPIPDLSRVVLGAPARVVLGGDAPPLLMKVVSRPAAIEPGTASAPVRLAFASAPPLSAGTPVQVEIDAEEHANVVLVPTEAVVREADETAIYVASGNKAQRRAITLGIVNKDHAEVTSGLKAGETIITQGQAGLPNGATITTEKPGEKEKSVPEKHEGGEPGPTEKK